MSSRHASLIRVFAPLFGLGLFTAGVASAQTQPPPGYPPSQPPAGYGAAPYGQPQQPPPGYPPPAGYPPAGDPNAAANYPPGSYSPPPPNYPPNGYPPPSNYPVAAQPSAPAYPAPPMTYAPMPGYHTHDGFYLNARLGLGYLGVSNSNFKFSGAAVNYGLAMGGALGPNLVLFGELFGAAVSNPNYTADGTTQSTVDTTLSLFGLGVGLAYYIMPANVFLSGTLATAQSTVSTGVDAFGNTANDDTNWGVLGRFALGKEWWATSDFGLGIGAELSLGRMSVPDAAAVHATEFALFFSATYN